MTVIFAGGGCGGDGSPSGGPGSSAVSGNGGDPTIADVVSNPDDPNAT